MAKTWLITGANRGLGAEIAKAALDSGDRVIATGRDRDAVIRSFGPDSDHLISLALDVTNLAQAEAAVAAAVARFGGIDILVNNAGYGHLGIFEETTPEDAQAQFATNVFGAFNVTRAVLPVMRRARNGRIFNISSIAGIRGSVGGGLYCASKHALEGFSEAIAKEVEGFGIFVTIVEPGFFRTGFLSADSARFAENPVADYAEASAQLRSFYKQRNGQQAGDPLKLAALFVQLANEAKPPLRFAAGSDAVEIAQIKITALQTELDRWRGVSMTTDGHFA